jgi:hypothetical protein
MNKFLICLALLAMPLMAAIAQEKTEDADELINQKAAELVKDKASKADKIVAAYNFVKDEITQVPSKFG